MIDLGYYVSVSGKGYAVDDWHSNGIITRFPVSERWGVYTMSEGLLGRVATKAEAVAILEARPSPETRQEG